MPISIETRRKRLSDLVWKSIKDLCEERHFSKEESKKYEENARRVVKPYLAQMKVVEKPSRRSPLKVTTLKNNTTKGGSVERDSSKLSKPNDPCLEIIPKMSVKLSSRSKILRKNRLRNSSMQSLDAKKPLVKNRSRTSSKKRAIVPKVTNSDEAEDNFPAIYERSKKTQKYSERKFRRIKRKPKAQVSNSQNKIDITCNNNLYQINQFNVKIVNSDSSRESKRSVIRENRTPSKSRKLYHLGSQTKNTRNIIKNPDSNASALHDCLDDNKARRDLFSQNRFSQEDPYPACQKKTSQP
ncbi:unnamed protein product [Moneuplotes crassus]|uniref:Uncharacterized protein n=1 Tax=Euplotes crassus TaxID=5936 RepID=A0AAD1X3V1_EUPCR|nr:unnamed protein product [Moneuplotes crassus]